MAPKRASGLRAILSKMGFKRRKRARRKAAGEFFGRNVGTPLSLRDAIFAARRSSALERAKGSYRITPCRHAGLSL
jgi:hypothetical protein